MAAQRLSMRKIKEVLRLRAQGLSDRAISRSLKIPRTTVRRTRQSPAPLVPQCTVEWIGRRRRFGGIKSVGSVHSGPESALPGRYGTRARAGQGAQCPPSRLSLSLTT